MDWRGEIKNDKKSNLYIGVVDAMHTTSNRYISLDISTFFTTKENMKCDFESCGGSCSIKLDKDKRQLPCISHDDCEIFKLIKYYKNYERRNSR